MLTFESLTINLALIFSQILNIWTHKIHLYNLSQYLVKILYETKIVMHAYIPSEVVIRDGRSSEHVCSIFNSNSKLLLHDMSKIITGRHNMM